jgi:two-component system phosphate regulon response regulator PhoB
MIAETNRIKKILLIDDEPDILALLEYLFSRLNYEVFSFPDVIPLTKITKIEPDVIILDQRLPTSLGSDFCLQLKTHPETQHIPVVILSAGDGLPQIAKDGCADGFIEKPFDIEKLNNTVKNAILLQAVGERN